MFTAILRASSLLSNLVADSPVGPENHYYFIGVAATTWRSNMAENRIALIGLSVLGLTATITIALAQNTSNPLLSGNTTNPRLSGNTVTQPPPVPVSPAPNLTILGTPLGRNAFTGLPCTGPGR